MASVTMECPVCAFRKVIRDGEPYNQKDLVCPNDNTDMVIATTSSEPTPEPETPAEAGPTANETGAAAPETAAAEAGPEPEAEPELEPLSPEALAIRLTKIMSLEKAIRDAEIVHDRKKKQEKDAKTEVESAKAVLLSYIRQCRVPKILPLFDGVKPETPTEDGAANVAGSLMQQIIDNEQAVKAATDVDLEAQIENHPDTDLPASEIEPETPEPARQPRRKAKP